MQAEEQQLLERVVECVGSDDFIARTAEADRTGKLSIENVRALQDLKVTGAVIDPALGEGGASVELAVRIIEALSYQDPSTAVALNMHWLGARAISRLPSFPRRDEAAAAIAAHEAMICGAISVPTEGLDSRKAGITCRDEGDTVVLNGRVGFGSMSDAAAYTILGGTMEGSPDSDPVVVMTIGRFGEEGLINHGNWSAMGLRATASNDIECRELRVAKADCLIAPFNVIQALFNAVPLVRTLQTAGGALGITGIWLGTAQAAFDFTIDYVKNRYGFLAAGTLVQGGGEYRADEAWAQSAIGNMDHWLGTSRVLLYDMIAKLPAYTDEAILARDLMRTTYHLRRMSEEVAMGAMKTCGAHAYVTARPLERIFRDLVGGVVMAWKTDQLEQTLGLGALGRPILFTGPAGS